VAPGDVILLPATALRAAKMLNPRIVVVIEARTKASTILLDVANRSHSMLQEDLRFNTPHCSAWSFFA
jgi:hypothetical protein